MQCRHSSSHQTRTHCTKNWKQRVKNGSNVLVSYCQKFVAILERIAWDKNGEAVCGSSPEEMWRWVPKLAIDCLSRDQHSKNRGGKWQPTVHLAIDRNKWRSLLVKVAISSESEEKGVIKLRKGFWRMIQQLGFTTAQARLPTLSRIVPQHLVHYRKMLKVGLKYLLSQITVSTRYVEMFKKDIQVPLSNHLG